jgi:hypothetical protein
MKPSRLRLIALVFKLLPALALLQASGTASAFTIIELGIVESVAGNLVTDAGTLETQVQPVTTALGTHLQSVFRSFAAPRGGSAGAGDSGFQSAWVNSSYTSFENTFFRTDFDGSMHLLMLGFDYSLTENVLLGLAVSSEQGDIDTNFNFGNQETDGTTVAPYFGWLISDNWSVDLSLGLTDTDIDQSRTTSSLNIVPPDFEIVLSQITSSPTSERDFKNLNLNGFWTAGNWNYGVRAGYLSINSDQDAYTESDDTDVDASSVELKQTQVGGDIAYGAESQLFLSAVMVSDSSSDGIEFEDGEQPSDDDDSILVGLGWRYYGEAGISTVVELNTREGKDDYKEESISFTLRLDFD